MNTTRLIVGGLVQGVGFRAFVSRTARVHGVRGWVRNLPDGTVEIVVQGAGSAFLDEISRGPRGALVRSVARSETDEPPLDGFELRW